MVRKKIRNQGLTAANPNFSTRRMPAKSAKREVNFPVSENVSRMCMITSSPAEFSQPLEVSVEDIKSDFCLIGLRPPLDRRRSKS